MDGLWSFWYYEWVELEFPEDGYVYFHGDLKELSKFLKRKLGPGKASTFALKRIRLAVFLFD